VRRICISIAAIAALGIGAGCGGSSGGGGAGGGGTQTASKEPIVIGQAGGFSGFMRPFDYPAYLGAQVAVRDINAKGGVLGRPLKLISSDAKSDKVQAGTSAAELLDKGAKYIIAPCDFDYGAAAAIEAQKRKIVAMSDCAGTVQFGVQGIGEYAYTMGNSGAGYAIAMAEWAYKKGWRNAYLLQDDSIEYHKQGCRAFNARWKELSGTKVALYDHFQANDASVASQVTRLKGLNPKADFVFLCSVIPPALTALRQIRAAGVDLPILASGQTFDGDFWQKSVPNVSDLYYPTIGLLDGQDPRPEVNRLVAEVKPRLKELLSPQVIGGYSAVQAFAVAAKKAGSVDGPKLQQALDSFKDEPLLTGPTTFTPDMHIAVTRRVAIMQVQKGERSLLTFWTPQSVPPLKQWVSG
jgi:branched-chain amino acid transport system substrate-binding protein